MIRLIFVLRRKPEMSLAEYQQYWREIHGPLVAKHATALNIHRYIQLHTPGRSCERPAGRGSRQHGADL